MFTDRDATSARAIANSKRTSASASFSKLTSTFPITTPHQTPPTFKPAGYPEANCTCHDNANADIAAAAAAWVPPGGDEMSESQDAELRHLVAARLPPRSVSALEELWGRFESSHPHDPEHAYLSLLATHPTRRGHGIAQRLLAGNLARWHALGVPAYLESTNPANDHRYRRRGFRPVGGCTAVLTDAAATTMWRDARR